MLICLAVGRDPPDSQAAGLFSNQQQQCQMQALDYQGDPSLSELEKELDELSAASRVILQRLYVRLSQNMRAVVD